jgi:hypothetical protein
VNVHCEVGRLDINVKINDWHTTVPGNLILLQTLVIIMVMTAVLEVNAGFIAEFGPD